MSIDIPADAPTWRDFFKKLSQIFAVVTALVLPLSTAALMIFFSATVFFSLLAGNWQANHVILRSNRVALMFLIFFGLFLVGLSYTTAQWSDALHILLKYSKFLLGFFLFSIFQHEKTATYAFFAFLLAASITLLLSFIKFFAHWDFIHRFVTDSGVFKDHIFTGFLLAFTSYCYAIFAFSIKKWWRWFFAILFLLAIYDVLFINLGRSGYVVLFSLILLFAWQQFSWKGLLTSMLVLAFLLVSLLFFPANFKDRLDVANTEISQYDRGNSDTSIGLRLEFYKNSLKLLGQHPWIGTGTGSFSHGYLSVTNNKHFVPENPHNEYLNIAVQFGLLGIIVLLTLFFVHWRESFRLAGLRQHFAQAVLLAITVGSLFNSWLMDATQGCFYVLFTALLFASLSKPSHYKNFIKTSKLL